MSAAKKTSAKTAKTAAAKAKKAQKQPNTLNSTIGENPLDLLVPAGAVKHLALVKRGKPAARSPEPTTVLTITVPQSLAHQVEHVLSISPELSFDQLMSTALAEVLQSIKGRHRGRGAASSSVKELATTVIRRS